MKIRADFEVKRRLIDIITQKTIVKNFKFFTNKKNKCFTKTIKYTFTFNKESGYIFEDKLIDKIKLSFKGFLNKEDIEDIKIMILDDLEETYSDFEKIKNLRIISFKFENEKEFIFYKNSELYKNNDFLEFVKQYLSRNLGIVTEVEVVKKEIENE
ncbi:MAG: hypothetical protein HXL14_02265 [Parvimonas sp.]|nr:hypothetical protein [Parvimonas sp.]